jgi:hypothetical protein
MGLHHFYYSAAPLLLVCTEDFSLTCRILKFCVLTKILLGLGAEKLAAPEEGLCFVDLGR